MDGDRWKETRAESHGPQVECVVDRDYGNDDKGDNDDTGLS